ncbi:MAG: (2Fe-2S)-binding protein [Ectothiorhodospiraceae bacterium]|nr:(2Fe-2S)-binding protein [Chromatiales bacterium]MCP5155533.1 (2Fe-2S)-binding protein [Ectothiorhodospiraceae bacterium]
MFQRLDAPSAHVTFDFEGRSIHAAVGDSVAAALLAAGVVDLRRSPVGGEPRGPWCLIGNCFECLVEIDGVPSRQACMTLARDGMRVRRQRGAAGARA